MPRINIESLVKHMEFELKRSLAQAAAKTFPDKEFDKNQLYREFSKALSFECPLWHNVPEHCVDRE